MKLKVPKLEIPSDDPFKNDLLGRKASAAELTEIIRSNDDPLVLCINAPWGEGKTTFLEMWQQMLITDGFKTLYFNAWENDFADDAFVSLIGELELGIEDLSISQTTRDSVQRHLEAAKKLGTGIIKRAIPTAIKVGTAGLVDMDDVAEQAMAELGEKLAEEQIKKYEEAKKSVAGFKEQLAKIAHEVSASESETTRSLIILIDELDRCRPPYAIKVLEAVKHFFSVENVVFVLTLDKQQLGHSIRSMYGTGMDVDGYLRRFIDIEFNLPTPKQGAFCKAQFQRFGLVDFFTRRRQSPGTQYDHEQAERIFSELFEALSFSLREQERAFTTLALAARSTPEGRLLHPLLLGVLILLKIKKPELYTDFISGKSQPAEVVKYFGSTQKGSAFLDTNYGVAVEAYLVSCRSDRFDSATFTQPYRDQYMNTSLPEPTRERASLVIRHLESMSVRDMYGVLDYLVKKIDMFTSIR